MQKELERYKQQQKSEKFDENRFVKEDEYTDQMEFLRQQINLLQNNQSPVDGVQANISIDIEEMYRIERKLKQKIDEIDVKFSNTQYAKT